MADDKHPRPGAIEGLADTVARMPTDEGTYGVRIGDRGERFGLDLDQAEEMARAGSAEGLSLYFVVDAEGRVLSEWGGGVCRWRRGSLPSRDTDTRGEHS